MEKINLTNLVANTKKNTNKTIPGFSSSEDMFEFFKVQNNTFKFIKNLSLYDLSSWVISKHSFLNKAKSKKNYISYKRGTIVLADFGVNFNSEISYNHPGVVLNQTSDKVLVAPCSTGRLRKAFKDPNDPATIYPQYLIGEKTHGFTKKTVILLDDVRWISKNRILNSFNIVDSNLFKKIQDSFLNIFADFYTKKIETLTQLKDSQLQEIENLKLKIEENEKIIKKFQDQNKQKRLFKKKGISRKNLYKINK